MAPLTHHRLRKRLQGSACTRLRPSLSCQSLLVRKRIGFWVSKGVLREVSAGVFDVQELLSSVEGVGTRGGSHLDDDIEHSPGTAAARAGAGGGRDAACAA